MSRAQDKVKELMQMEGVGYRPLARMLHQYPNCIHEQLNKHKDIKAEKYYQILDLLGYEIQIIKTHDVSDKLITLQEAEEILAKSK